MQNTKDKARKLGLVERAVKRNANLKQYRDKRFGVILSAKQVRRLEIEETYPGGWEAYSNAQMEQAFRKAFGEFLDNVDKIKEEKRKEREQEKIEKRRKAIEADRVWRRRQQEKPVTDKGEYKTFAALAEDFKSKLSS